jgi:polyhydroxyalkanoic acid synthase PhaR subunit
VLRKELLRVSEERRNRATTDLAELWRQWFETGTRMWSGALGAGQGTGQGNQMDPYGLYRQWFNSLEDFQELLFDGGFRSPAAALSRDGGGSTPVIDPASAAQNPAAAEQPALDAVKGQAVEAQNLWKQWFEGAQDSWQKAAGLGREAVELGPRWVAMWDQIRNNFLSVGGYPTDPLQFATRWYNATSGPFSDFIGDLIEREEMLDTSSHLLQHYASFYKVFRRNSEEYLKSLQIPVRSDVTRVAGLVVALEDKVDRLEEAFEDFEYGYAEPATAESVGNLENRIANLEGRLEGVEGKIDRLLAALENAPQNGAQTGPQEYAQAVTQAETVEDSREEGASEAPQANGEVRATDAARRKAQELDVDLTEVEGTGAGGQITVDDVRRANAQANAQASGEGES